MGGYKLEYRTDALPGERASGIAAYLWCLSLGLSARLLPQAARGCRVTCVHVQYTCAWALCAVVSWVTAHAALLALHAVPIFCLYGLRAGTCWAVGCRPVAVHRSAGPARFSLCAGVGRSVCARDC